MILSKIYIVKVDDNCYTFSSFEEADKYATHNRDKAVVVERFTAFLDRGVANDKHIVIGKEQISHLIDIIQGGAKKEDIIHDIFD